MLFALSLLSSVAAADQTTPEGLPRVGEIVGNPQAAYNFAGWDQLARMLGVSDESGLTMGGYFIPELSWVASGGAKPDSAFDNFALGIHASLDANRAVNIPGGTLGVEFLEYSGGAVNDAAGSVQNLTTMDGPSPRTREQLMQLWWRQSLFDNKFIIQIGKMNGPGMFGNVQYPVLISETIRQDRDISNLLFVPVGLNPTLFGRMPSYYNTGYGLAAHFAPTKNLYLSYGLFDANGIAGKQTGLDVEPNINTRKLHIGEFGYSWRAGEARKPGRIGVGGWWQTGAAFTPALQVENGATGFYLFAHQRLWYKHPEVDEAGIIGYLQYAHTGSDVQAVKDYAGAGLSALRLIPGRPADNVSVGMAWSSMNDTPGAGEFFYPGVSSSSKDLRDSEFMFQAVYQSTYFFKLSRGFWSITPVLAYTYIPDPGRRPDLPAASVLTLRLVTLF